MYRCLIAAVAACTFVTGAGAQSPLRQFPADALRGELVIGAAPEATLNGTATRLGAGARVRGTNNLVQTPASLSGARLIVNYTADPQGLLREVWVLNDAEAARSPWPRTRQEAASWRFDLVTQTWAKP